MSGLGNLSTLVGVEIGALDFPLLLRSEGQVLYVDHADTDTLRAKYENFPGHNAEKIVEVDAIWGESTLAQALGDGIVVDYVVASHVIEHVPDLLSWFEEIRAILKPAGTVHLAIPDRRYTFDIRRQESRIADVVHAYVVKARKPLPHQLLDFEIHYMPVDTKEAWNGLTKIPRFFDKSRVEHGLAVVREVIRTDVYLDIHCWVFTPMSFALLMEQLSALEILHLSCSDFYDTEPGELEFEVILRENACAAANADSWRQMAERVRNHGSAG